MLHFVGQVESGSGLCVGPARHTPNPRDTTLMNVMVATMVAFVRQYTANVCPVEPVGSNLDRVGHGIDYRVGRAIDVSCIHPYIIASIRAHVVKRTE